MTEHPLKDTTAVQNPEGEGEDSDDYDDIQEEEDEEAGGFEEDEEDEEDGDEDEEHEEGGKKNLTALLLGGDSHEGEDEEEEDYQEAQAAEGKAIANGENSVAVGEKRSREADAGDEDEDLEQSGKKTKV